MPARKKNPAALALATLRWKDKTQADKDAVGAALHEAAKSMSAETKTARAKAGAAARWKGHRKAKKKAGK